MPGGLGPFIGPAVAVVLVVLARLHGLSWHDLGFARKTWRKGALYGGVAIALVALVYIVGALLPMTRSAFADIRYDMAMSQALLLALVLIPVHTILIEEVAFRGVLPAMLRGRLGTAWAIGLSSALFGLWHVIPSLRLNTQNAALGSAVGTDLRAQILVVAGTVLFTGLAGVLLSELRRRSGSVLASAGLHWATNGLGVLVSALLWASAT
ncbi:CPBP family intramembrane glutamic endopeptidase [Actinokineospora xionganensis]|uniref:CPBP family intramembrane metalloprotease n=1 Tax=Actinokineospora xionganensis TaxID=2684470 RepID=A0ABR7KZN3_9PSEU|nr:CPBP family intramembrane glutamic endopeptidase [Actinokineospora xionganensis]MBC6445888.1 CPBP family intramembrane metalloprotease [Actinokineospora xionganensis]